MLDDNEGGDNHPRTGKVTPEDALRALQPRNISARLRDLLPLIDERLCAGYLYEEIIAALAESGLTVNLNTLKSNVQRYRQKKKEEGTAPAKANAAASPPNSGLLSRLMRPDAAEESADLQRYEQLGKQKAFQKQPNRQEQDI